MQHGEEVFEVWWELDAASRDDHRTVMAKILVVDRLELRDDGRFVKKRTESPQVKNRFEVRRIDETESLPRLLGFGRPSGLGALAAQPRHLTPGE